MRTDPKERAAPLASARLVISLRHRHLSRVVNGADALLQIQPQLAEFFSRDELENHFKNLVGQTTAFFAAHPESAALYGPCDLHRAARQHAAKLLAAGRFNRVGKGI